MGNILFLVLLAIIVFLSLPHKIKMSVGESFMIEKKHRPSREEENAQLDSIYNGLIGYWQPGEEEQYEADQARMRWETEQTAEFWNVDWRD